MLMFFWEIPGSVSCVHLTGCSPAEPGFSTELSQRTTPTTRHHHLLSQPRPRSPGNTQAAGFSGAKRKRATLRLASSERKCLNGPWEPAQVQTFKGEALRVTSLSPCLSHSQELLLTNGFYRLLYLEQSLRKVPSFMQTGFWKAIPLGPQMCLNPRLDSSWNHHSGPSQHTQVAAVESRGWARCPQNVQVRPL